jgi:hypothetical protein
MFAFGKETVADGGAKRYAEGDGGVRGRRVRGLKVSRLRGGRRPAIHFSAYGVLA